MELTLKAADGCDEPATATGQLQWIGGNRVPNHFTLRKAPYQLVLSVGGAKVLGAWVRAPEAERWHPMRITRFRGVSIMRGRVKGWNRGGSTAEFRLSIDISRSAGFQACYLTSPALFEFNGRDPLWQETASKAEIFTAETQLWQRVVEFPVQDSIVWMEVPGQQPDRTVLDAGARVRRNRLLVTCTEILPDPGRRFARDPYFYWRALLEESSCGSVQTFRSPDAQDTLNLRLFLAGILVSAAVAILLEALLIGRTEGVHDPHPS